MEVSGKIKLIYDEQSFASGFTKREFVVTTQEQYPQDIKFECVKDKTAMLNGVQPGDDVTVHFNLRGNEYQGKYFVNLQAWRLEKGTAGSSNENFEQFQGVPNAAPLPTANDLKPQGENFENDDLPF
ncbi:MAG: DUF3127 domain-containing protein [Bacteroidia bacterium]